MLTVTALSPGGTMFVEGHGEHWRAVAEYVEQGMGIWDEAM